MLGAWIKFLDKISGFVMLILGLMVITVASIL